MEKLKIYVICSVTLICVFLFGGLLYTAVSEPETLPVQTQPRQELPVVVIDAGHGGEDSGAVANGVLEKDINLDIALRLRDMLRVCGFEVVMTRDTDVSIYDSSSAGIRSKKQSDLKNRAAIINKSGNQILVSIHQNKFEQEKYSGAQVFYSTNDPGSEKLAEAIRQSVRGLLQPDNQRELKPAGDGIYLLREAEIPAVIVECGFLSNREEAGKLSREDYRRQMAFAICCGVMNYLSAAGGVA